jgi:hypothetical protein
MLQQTFLHLKGIGPTTERAWWRSGITDWQGFLDHPRSRSEARMRLHRETVEESIRHYHNGVWSFFNQHLPGKHRWRAYGDLKDQALYVDIETTGGSSGNDITMIGTYDGHEFRCFIQGKDLWQAEAYLEKFPLIVTFNGACFDLPMIRACFPRILFNHVHVDLRSVLGALGYKGGLKAIERKLGIQRPDDMHCLDGRDAIYLWQDYRRGSARALDLLIRYNEQDVRNMEPLMELAWRQSIAQFSTASGRAEHGRNYRA